MPDKKVVATISYSNLMDLIFILSDQAATYHGVPDDLDELTVGQFTEWLGTMRGEVELFEIDYSKEVMPDVPMQKL